MGEERGSGGGLVFVGADELGFAEEIF